MKKYVSAFANHEGGHIYFGIDDVRASVIGEELSPSEQKRTGNLSRIYFIVTMSLALWKGGLMQIAKNVDPGQPA